MFYLFQRFTLLGTSSGAFFSQDQDPCVSHGEGNKVCLRMKCKGVGYFFCCKVAAGQGGFGIVGEMNLVSPGEFIHCEFGRPEVGCFVGHLENIPWTTIFIAISHFLGRGR